MPETKGQIDKELKEQKYDGEPIETVFDDDKVIKLTYDDIKLYGYNARMELFFFKNEDENLEDSEFAFASYYIDMKKASLEESSKCFDFFYKELTNKYGDNTYEETQGNDIIHAFWDVNNKECKLTRIMTSPMITYKSFDIIRSYNNRYTSDLSGDELKAMQGNNGL